MLDDKDVQKLVSILATKEDVKEMKQDITDLRELVHGLYAPCCGIMETKICPTFAKATDGQAKL
ncbi:MAG: hypothetical protein UV08_C0011G0007 [Parcubacteria group bacterium GW2011_GWA2_42_18]|nr:MAG: hypothetical protein UV08_C0011G0007 [Parcubacteria group bacterium GW2011_GWA2_42_18]